MLQMSDFFFFFFMARMQRAKTCLPSLGGVSESGSVDTYVFRVPRVAAHSFQICSQKWLRSGEFSPAKMGWEIVGSILRRLFNLKVS